MTSVSSRVVLLVVLIGFAGIAYPATSQGLTVPDAARSAALPLAPATSSSVHGGGVALSGVPPTGSLTINQASSPVSSKDEGDKNVAVSLASALAWPVALLLCFFMLRKQLIALIGKLANLKYGEFAIEFQAEKSNKVMRRISAKKVVTPKDIDAVFEAVKHNEWATLVIARMLMRRGLMAMVDTPANEDPSLLKMLPRAEGKLGNDLKDKLERLRAVTYYAEWWRGDTPTGEQWQWAVENAKSLIEQLFGKLPIH